MNAPIDSQTIADPLAHARKEASINFGLAAHYADIACGYLQVGNDKGATYPRQEAELYWKLALLKMDFVRAATLERLKEASGPDSWAKKMAFLKNGERVCSRWALLVEAYLFSDPDFAADHCNTIRDITRDAFAQVRALRSATEEETKHQRAARSDDAPDA